MWFPSARRPTDSPRRPAPTSPRRSDFEFLELAWLQQELGGPGPGGLPPLLLNKFLQLGRKRAAAAVAPAPSEAH